MNRLNMRQIGGIALIVAGVIGLVLSVYAIHAMGHWQGIWVYIAIFAFFTSIACVHSVLSRILIGLYYAKFGP